MKWVFSLRWKVSNVFDSLITAGNSFQIVGAVKLKEHLLKLVVQKGIDQRFWLADRGQCDGWYMWRRFLRYGGWLVDKLLYVRRAILYWIHLRTGSQWRCESLLPAEPGWWGRATREKSSVHTAAYECCRPKCHGGVHWHSQSSPNLAIRQMNSMKYDFWLNSTWRFSAGFHSHERFYMQFSTNIQFLFSWSIFLDFRLAWVFQDWFWEC